MENENDLPVVDSPVELRRSAFRDLATDGFVLDFAGSVDGYVGRFAVANAALFAVEFAGGQFGQRAAEAGRIETRIVDPSMVDGG